MPALLIMLAGAFSFCAYGLPADFYSDRSRLSSGKWVKIKVSDCGIQFISDAELRKLGFTDVENVRVFGYGGRLLPDALKSNMADDLPASPSMRVNGGLLFFGYDNLRWIADDRGIMQYSHKQHPYSSDSWYFLGIAETAPMVKSDRRVSTAKNVVTDFRARKLYERELIAPSNTGRILLGEDFRAGGSRNFTFELPGNVSDSAYISMRFATYLTSGSSSLMLTSNGQRLPSTSGDKIEAVTSSGQFMRLTNVEKVAPNAGTKLTLGVEYSYSGAIKLANLDYIRVEYDRRLKLEDGELYFYDTYRGTECVRIEGCDASTVVWDVTDPARPAEVEYTLDGQSAVFSPDGGYHEFVAFNPNVSRRSINAEYAIVANQDLHSLTVPDMVIITLPEFMNAANRLAAHHESFDGMTVHVVTPETVYNEFSSGTPDVGAFRRMLKMWYDRDPQKMRYCLLIGRPTYDNKMLTPVVRESGYNRLPIWQSENGVSSNTSYSTDDYIAMLADSEDESFMMSTQILSIGVGRLPVKSAAEAEAVVSKIIKYVEQPEYGMWRNNVMIIADDQDNGVHLDQAQNVYAGMRSGGNGRHFIYDRLYLDSYPLSYSGTGAVYPEARKRLYRKINEGLLMIDYIGHASPRGWGHEGLMTWLDIKGMNNSRLPFIYAATCEFARWDDDDVSGGEELFLNPNSGVVSIMTPSRSVYITQNGVMNRGMASRLFERGADGKGKRLGDIVMDSKNYYKDADDNKLRYCLLGDPAMRLPSPELELRLDEIDGKNVADAGSDIPELKSKAKVSLKGQVCLSDGSLVSDYNGVIELRLYDAETVVETYGNGAEGKKTMYNDRLTMLASTSATVKNGEWEAILIIPSEISNNYSPALLSMYAYDKSSGIEANGSSERMYVYGYDATSDTDTSGPAVEKFYLNNHYFASGGVVNSNPVVFARVSDESGINLSDGGIGHKMLLTLDNKIIYDDVNFSYTSDPEDYRAGEIVYPLSDITPGSHSLEFEVWDNVGNSSRSVIEFNVAAAADPVIFTVTPDCNPAVTSVVFTLQTDRPMSRLDCDFEVFDLNGRKIWSNTSGENTDMESCVSASWNLCDSRGVRVPRGIYLFRAKVTTPEGTYSSKTGKLAVTAASASN